MRATAAIYPHIFKNGDHAARLVRMPRIRVAQIVMDHLAHGWSAEEICRQHAYLTPAEAHAAMLYYWDHKEEIDREIEDEWRQAEREAAEVVPPPAILRLRASRHS